MAEGRMGARAWPCMPVPFGKPMLGKRVRLGRGLCDPFLGTPLDTLRPGQLGPGLLGQCLGTTSVALGPGLVGPFPSASHTTQAKQIMALGRGLRPLPFGNHW